MSAFSRFSELIRFTKFQTDKLPGAGLSSDSFLPHYWVLHDQLDAGFFMDVTDVC